MSAIARATLRLYDKFLAWARTAPQTLRNPLYHWTHLELQRYFGIDELLDWNPPHPSQYGKGQRPMLATADLLCARHFTEVFG